MGTPVTSEFTAEEALQRLKDGNARFLAGKARVFTGQKDVLASLVSGQRPYATILGCSDSRVPPELVFDAGFGELFVIRVAGNTLGPTIFGTLQYAGTHLGTPLFVVMGHEACGAVGAAINRRFHRVELESRIDTLLDGIEPALNGLDPMMPETALLEAAVEANVRHTLAQLRATPEVQARRAQGTEMRLVGAIYELSTGRVRFLE